MWNVDFKMGHKVIRKTLWEDEGDQWEAGDKR
jgi:hypothetical protein